MPILFFFATPKPQLECIIFAASSGIGSPRPGTMLCFRSNNRPRGDRHTEEFIEIRQRGDGRLVTLLDVVSPINKTTASGRQAYLAKRLEARNCNANVVEIDLVLQGQPTLEYSRDGLPDWDYAVTVTKSNQPERHEIYTATL